MKRRRYTSFRSEMVPDGHVPGREGGIARSPVSVRHGGTPFMCFSVDAPALRDVHVDRIELIREAVERGIAEREEDSSDGAGWS